MVIFLNRQGYALTEVIVAMFILSLSTAAILYETTTSYQELDSSWQRLQAIELAQSKLEQTLSLSYDYIVSIDRTILPEAEGFEYAIMVSDESSGQLKNIKVTIYYTKTALGAEQQVSLIGAKAKNYQ